MHKKQDYGFKDLFSHRELVYGLVNGFLREKWLVGTDINSLEKVNAHYIDGKYRQREDDVVWKINLNGECIYLYLLLEFQSQIDKFMATRLMGYIGLLYQDLIKSKALTLSKGLPPILPWVIYTGKYKWSAPRSSQLLLEKAVPPELKNYFPCFNYRVLDIGHDVLELNTTESDNLMVYLIELERAVYERAQAVPIVQRLIERLRSSEHDSVRRAFAAYISRVLKLKQVHPNIDSHDLEEVGHMLAERIEEHDRSLIHLGRNEGRNEGIQEGMQKGIQKVAYALLKKGVNKGLITEVSGVPLDKLENLEEELLTS